MSVSNQTDLFHHVCPHTTLKQFRELYFWLWLHFFISHLKKRILVQCRDVGSKDFFRWAVVSIGCDLKSNLSEKPSAQRDGDGHGVGAVLSTELFHEILRVPFNHPLTPLEDD
jgi:hypothetical protein